MENQVTLPNSIGRLALALAKAQGLIQGASKDSANPFFDSKYADLASVWEACRIPLSSCELSVIQTIHKDGDGLILRTVLAHSSGETVTSDLPILIGLGGGKKDMQALGSAITYARRYGLSAMVGVCPEDDDGEAAVGRDDKKPGQKYDKAKPPVQKNQTQNPQKDDEEITTDQANIALVEMKNCGWKMDELKKLMMQYKCGTVPRLKVFEYREILEIIKTNKPQDYFQN